MLYDPSNEDTLVWLEDISKLDYVRESFILAGTRIKPPPFSKSAGKLIGYTTIKKSYKDTQGIGYLRRCFILYPRDRGWNKTWWKKSWGHEPDYNDVYKGDSQPMEAVCPRNIIVGKTKDDEYFNKSS